eukprot:gene15335-20665_t
MSNLVLIDSMSEFLNELDKMIEFCDTSPSFSQMNCCHVIRWKENGLHSNNFDRFKSECNTISNSCVKLALMYQGNAVAKQSLMYEVGQQYDSFKEIFNYKCGMVTEIVKEIEKLPTSNKAAYRRSMLQKCMVIKDTIREFESSIEESEEKLITAMSQNWCDYLEKQSTKLQTSIIDLGSELYSPFETDGVTQDKFDEVKGLTKDFIIVSMDDKFQSFINQSDYNSLKDLAIKTENIYFSNS